MSREIRRVPPDWQHPTWEDYIKLGIISRSDVPPYAHREPYVPMFNASFEEAALNWKHELAEWEQDKDGIKTHNFQYGATEYWEYENPPDRDRHRIRHWEPEEATAYQVYETITEGTPVSPVFETREELLNWLQEELNFSVQGALQFVGLGYTLGSFSHDSTGFHTNYQTIDPGAKAYEPE